ncbi:MAG: hypothetical protein GXY03_12100 [Solirubrobacterales bacterium]|nr:hypothetical protein [Solirubrobacterales bacterium]
MEASAQQPPVYGGAVTVRPDRWWLVVLLGLLSIVVGVLALAYPDVTLLALGLFFGINLLIAGALWVAVGANEDSGGGGRALRLIVGFLAILAGLVCLVRPGASVLALLLAVAFWFVMVGVADLARAISEPQGRALSAFLGLIGIAAGIVLVADPDIGLTTLALLAGIAFIVRGTVEVIAGIALRRLGSR